MSGDAKAGSTPAGGGQAEGATGNGGPLEVVELDDAIVAALVPERDPRGHKGTYGRILIVAGSLDYLGAALLVSNAAGRAGAGLIRLAVPASLQPLVAGRFLEATTVALPEESPGIVDPEAAAARLDDVEHDALVVGPGLRAGAPTIELVMRLLGSPGGTSADRAGAGGHEARAPAPALVDAEALNSLAKTGRWWERVRRPCVLTPHVGEFGRLRGDAAAAAGGHDAGRDLVADDDARAAAALDAARGWGQVVVLKGAKSVIAAPDGSVARAPFENPALASGGTGDVLSGTIGALLAQGLAPFDAARVGVYLHGVAGESVRERIGDAGLLASDLPDEIARARRHLARYRERRRGGRRVGFVLARPEEDP